jgi:ATP phosphoribosyltransferase
LRANGLKVLADGVILKSQACLVASRAVELGERQTRALETIAARVKGAV